MKTRRFQSHLSSLLDIAQKVKFINSTNCVLYTLQDVNTATTTHGVKTWTPLAAGNRRFARAAVCCVRVTQCQVNYFV